MKTIAYSLLAATLAGIVSFPVNAAGAQTDALKPISIADKRSTSLKLDGRDAAHSIALANPVEIRTPDAAFIKVHFKRFNLPRGVTLEVSNPAGTEVYRYSSTQRDGFTWDKAGGDNGKTSFSAMSITGPVAVLRLVGTPQESWTSAHGVDVDSYLEGYPEAMLPKLQQEGLLDLGPRPMSICGVDDKKAVACYADQDRAAVDRSRPVAKIFMPSGGVCTAWRVGPNNRVFTNNHCTATQSGIAGSEIWFNYQRSTCTGAQATVVKVAGDQMLETNSGLDFTLFTVKGFDTISQFGYLGLDTREPQLGEEIFIAGHPGGRMKELSVVSDRDGGGRCKVNDAVTTGSGGNTDMGYYCDTEGGNSGSPVIARSSNRVIALHHFGGCMNQGARMSMIWPQVSEHFGGQVPGGDDGGSTPTPTPGTQTYTNGTDVAIRDFATVESAISVSGRTGNASSTTAVSVNIVHTYIGDLKVDLVAPDGSVYVLHNRTGSSTDNINKTYTVNLSGEALNGSWKLRVNDGAGGDIGRIDTWSITF